MLSARGTAATACLLLVLMLVGPSANADDGPRGACEQHDAVGNCSAWVPIGGSPGSSGGSGAARLCLNSVGSPIACDNGWGVWSNSLLCHLRAWDPQPARDDPKWADVWRGRLTGTPWTEQVATRAESPDCGHVYEKQGSYRVRATSYWSVEWSAMGESGQISFTLSREVHNLIGELQVVTRR